MGLFDRGQDPESPEDYIELEVPETAAIGGGGERSVHIAVITEQRDVLAVRDALYDEDVVIADIGTLTTSGPQVEHIIDELRQTVEELGGDMVKKGDDQLIMTPSGVSISRRKLNQR